MSRTYAELPRLMTMMTGDEKHGPRVTSTLEVAAGAVGPGAAGLAGPALISPRRRWRDRRTGAVLADSATDEATSCAIHDRCVEVGVTFLDTSAR